MAIVIRTQWRLAVAVAALVLTFAWLDRSAVLAGLTEAAPGPVAVAVALLVLNVFVFAYRWHFTAGRLGLSLPLGVATREYFMSLFVNAVLPGGVVGDVARVFRQRGERPETLAVALQSVVLERTAGQITLALVLVLGTLTWGTKAIAGTLLALQAAFVITVLALAFVLARIAVGRLGLRPAPWRAAMRSAWLGPALPVQLVLSLGSVLLLVAAFWSCARAVGSPLTFVQALVLVPWLLAATTIPVSVGGWGVRELAAASLFAWADFDAARGTAASLVFGLVALTSSLPGAWFLAVPRHRLRHDAGGESGQSNSTS